jgi:tetratricopeptide (TPR) repeat protein
MTCGCLAAIAAILFHSSMDFIFKSPAVVLYFFFLLALAVSVSHTHRHGSKETLLQESQLFVNPSRKSLRSVIYVSAGLLFEVGLLVNGGNLLAHSRMDGIGPYSWDEKNTQQELMDMAKQVQSALQVSPLDSYAHFTLAGLQRELGNTTLAEPQYLRAIRLNPSQATYLQDYGEFKAEQGDNARAEAFFTAGIKRDKSGPDRRRRYAEFLLSTDQREKGLQVMGEVLAMEPSANKDDIQYLVDSGYSDEEIRQNLPALVEPYLALAEHLEKQNDQQTAAAVYRNALTYVEKEKKINPNHFYRICEYFNRQQRYEEALDVALQGIEAVPSDFRLRVLAGNLYRQLGMTSKAIEQYQQALVIDHDNVEAKRNLAKLKPI